MSASIWYPGVSIPSGGSITRAVESQTIAAGQTVVTFLTFEYVPGSGDLFIFIDGLYFVDYTTTSSTTITLDSAFTHSVELVAIAGIPLSEGIGGDSVAFLAAGADSVARTAQSKIREAAPISVVDKGAEVSVDCTASVTAAAASGSEVAFPEGAWVVTSTPSVTGSKMLSARPGAILSGAGAAALGFLTTPSGISQHIHKNGAASDVASNYWRRETNHVGGTPGFVNSCGFFDTYVQNSASTDFAWGLISRLSNNAAAGENAAAYFQAYKQNTGPTWALLGELIEPAEVNDPAWGSVAFELDLRANGTDALGNRIGMDLVLAKQLPAGAQLRVSYGFRIQNAGTDVIVGRGYGFSAGMTATYGFDASTGTMLSAAFKAGTNQPIILATDDSRKLYYDGSGLRYANAAGTTIGRITDAGAYQGAGGVQVVGARDTGWSAMTGTANKATVYDTATVTTAQLAGRVMALQAALTTHGLIGV